MATGNPEGRSAGISSLPPGLRFAAMFILAVAFLPNLMTSLVRPALAVTIATTTALGRLLGLSVTSSGEILTVNGFAMHIVAQCTAINYVFILAIAILLYTRHPLAYRIKGVAVGTAIVIAVNAIRLIATGLAGTVSPALFNFVHEYLWVALFALLVFIVWKVWADRKLLLPAETRADVKLMVSGCTIMFVVLILFHDSFRYLLTALAAPMFRLLVADPGATVVWNGMLVFSKGEKSIGMGLFFELANVAVYAGMMLPYLRRNRQAIPLAFLGLIALVVLYAELVAFMGMNGINNGPEAAQLFQFFASSIFLATPMALYWMTTGYFSRKKNL